MFIRYLFSYFAGNKKLRMQIIVNNKAMEMAEGSTLSALAETLRLPEKGVAVAVNNQMIPREEWSATSLQEGVQVVVIKAACGG